MPRGDKTGPNGMGSMTGRAAGFCTGNNAPGFMNTMSRFTGWMGRGMGMGMRGGRRGGGWFGGFGNQSAMPFAQPQQPQSAGINEKEWLQNEQQMLKNSLEQIQNRLDALEGEK